MSESLENILGYYRDKIKNINGEKREWLEQLDQVKQHVSSVQEREIKAEGKKAQIAECQKALSETHIQLFDEKRLLLQQQRDNEVLKKIDCENS